MECTYPAEAATATAAATEGKGAACMQVEEALMESQLGYPLGVNIETFFLLSIRQNSNRANKRNAVRRVFTRRRYFPYLSLDPRVAVTHGRSLSSLLSRRSVVTGSMIGGTGFPEDSHRRSYTRVPIAI